MTERKAKMNWEVVSNVSCLVPIFRRQPLDFRIQFPGRNTVCCQGTCLMGPDHGTWCCSNSLIIGNCALFVFYVAIPVHWAMAALAIALLLVVEYQLWSATFTEAGILPRQPYELTPSGQPAPTVIVNGVTVHLKSCNTCNIYRSAGATARIIAHSVTRACMQTTAREALPRLRQLRGRVRSLPVGSQSSASCCVGRFDHHCPWVCNCVGKRNYRYFVGFLICELWLPASPLVLAHSHSLVQRSAFSTRTSSCAACTSWFAKPLDRGMCLLVL